MLSGAGALKAFLKTVPAKQSNAADFFSPHPAGAPIRRREHESLVLGGLCGVGQLGMSVRIVS
jgi:hypothetical protein